MAVALPNHSISEILTSLLTFCISDITGLLQHAYKLRRGDRKKRTVPESWMVLSHRIKCSLGCHNCRLFMSWCSYIYIFMIVINVWLPSAQHYSVSVNNCTREPAAKVTCQSPCQVYRATYYLTGKKAFTCWKNSSVVSLTVPSPGLIINTVHRNNENKD